MPIYEYKCGECGKVSEYRITSQSQVNSLSCKNCGSQKLERKMSIPIITSGGNSNSHHSCCGNPGEGCSTPGSCCGH
jgi:putative FmdB family regulatory protein